MICSMSAICSGLGATAKSAWLGQRVTELGGGVQPEGDGDLDLGERGFTGAAVGDAAGQIGGFGDEDPVLIAPADGDRVLVYWVRPLRSGLR